MNRRELLQNAVRAVGGCALAAAGPVLEASLASDAPAADLMPLGLLDALLKEAYLGQVAPAFTCTTGPLLSDRLSAGSGAN